ncbi:MAG: hypothetical protein V1820_03495 [archaeon]
MVVLGAFPVFTAALVLAGISLAATGFLAKVRYLCPLGVALALSAFVPDPFKLVSFGILSGAGLLFFKPGNANAFENAEKGSPGGKTSKGAKGRLR